MKKYLSILFLLAAAVSFAQVYHFNYLMEVTVQNGKSEKKEFARKIMISPRTDYQMMISDHGNKLTAVIWEAGISHYLNVKKDGNGYLFTYDYSLKAVEAGKINPRNLRIAKKDDLTFEAYILARPDSKKYLSKYTVKFKESEIHFTEFFNEFRTAAEKKAVTEKIQELLPPDKKMAVSEVKTMLAVGPEITQTFSYSEIEPVTVLIDRNKLRFKHISKSGQPVDSAGIDN